MQELFRHLPSVDFILGELAKMPESLLVPRPLLREAITSILDELREGIRMGRIADQDFLLKSLHMPVLTANIFKMARPSLKKVINATGVVIHTNLGRSVLAKEAIDAVVAVAANYSNLEFDLQLGERGSRHALIEKALTRLTGAQSALVVNNNAAAVLIVLSCLAKGREVIVSRGELVEIGGSFRIPDIMAQSGAILREVGTTNRTHLGDYEKALNENTAAILGVHTSNYRIIGFTAQVEPSRLRALAEQHGIPFIRDLGSGSFIELNEYGLFHEPTVKQALSEGAHVLTFSGDKVLGGPQAGIIIGEEAILKEVRKHPLMRALRPDKMTLAALEATLRIYVEPDAALERIPTLRMISMNEEDIRTKAERLVTILRENLEEKFTFGLQPGESLVGGGAFPEYGLPTTLITVNVKGFKPGDLRKALLESEPPVIGRTIENNFYLDPRTIDEADFLILARSFAQIV